MIGLILFALSALPVWSSPRARVGAPIHVPRGPFASVLGQAGLAPGPVSQPVLNASWDAVLAPLAPAASLSTLSTPHARVALGLSASVAASAEVGRRDFLKAAAKPIRRAPPGQTAEAQFVMAGAQELSHRLSDVAASRDGKAALLDRFFFGKEAGGSFRASLVSAELPRYKGPRTKRAGTTLLNFPTFHWAPLSQPLETFGLYNCAALVIIDHHNGRHFLAHVTADLPARVLERTLREEGISWREADIFILPGSDRGTKLTVGHIRAALTALDGSTPGKIRFVHLPPDSNGDRIFSIVSYRGKVFFAKTGSVGSFKLGGKYFQGVFPR